MVQRFVWCSNLWKLPSCGMRSSYLTHWDRQGLHNLLMCHGNNTLTIYFNDSVSNTNTASLSYATSHQAADLWMWERHFMCSCIAYNTTLAQPFINWKFRVMLHTNKGLLTMPFCTLKPSWNLRSGLFMRTVVTGGQLTILSFTFTWFFRPCTVSKKHIKTH